MRIVPTNTLTHADTINSHAYTCTDAETHADREICRQTQTDRHTYAGRMTEEKPVRERARARKREREREDIV